MYEQKERERERHKGRLRASRFVSSKHTHTNQSVFCRAMVTVKPRVCKLEAAPAGGVGSQKICTSRVLMLPEIASMPQKETASAHVQYDQLIQYEGFRRNGPVLGAPFELQKEQSHVSLIRLFLVSKSQQ